MSDRAIHSGSGIWCVDLNQEGFPLLHMGLCPVDAFVDERENLFLLNGNGSVLMVSDYEGNAREGTILTGHLNIGTDDKKFFRSVNFLGDGSGTVVVTVDGDPVVTGHFAMVDAFPDHRTVFLPRGTKGRTICLEVTFIGRIEGISFEASPLKGEAHG